MDEIKWRQIRRAPASKQRDPVQGEFFNQESITSLAAQITREGIGQNPLDARVHSPVRVRVFVSGDAGALTSSEAEKYFGGLRRHVEASADEGSDVGDQFEGPCRFITIEDFNTTGLTGDPQATDPPGTDEKNDFFYFFRAEGKSGKSGSDRGRWGVGKYVFPMASQINSFFGLTVRDDASPGGTGPLLIGQSVLRNHRIEDQSYEPDGWLADWQNGIPVPFRDSEMIESFRNTWNVIRTDEPGLSVIVPYVEDELGPIHLTKAILTDYYFAVLRNKLELEVSSPELDENIVISQHTLLDEALEHMEDEEQRKELRRKITLATWHATLPEDEFFNANRIEDGRPTWKSELIDDSDCERIRNRLESGQSVAVRVPVHVDAKDEEGEGAWSHFDVVFKYESNYHEKPVFVREGLIVPDVTSSRPNNIRCFVTVDDDELARMVGDAEGPAHTNWSPRTHLFSGRYSYGQNWLALIKRAPGEILRIIREDDEDEDRKLLAQFFPMPPEGPAPDEPGGTDDDPGTDPPPPEPPTPPPPRKPRRTRIDGVEGGFSVHLTEDGQGVSRLRVRAAYDRRRGSAFKNWREDDFDFAKDPINLNIAGGVVHNREGNVLIVDVDEPESFSLYVRGFDEKRDLRVAADSEVDE